MKSNTFYIHINANTLAHYWVRGIFCPARYMENREADIQNTYDNYLLVSDKKWNSDADCSIEIVLDKNEISNLKKIQRNYFISLDCFPISRTQKIIFENKEKGETVIWNINSGAAFIPEWSLSFERKLKKDKVVLKNIIEVETDKNTELKLPKKLKSFDRLMGGFAFFKVSFLNNLKINTPKNYLSAISFFNKKIENDVVAQNIDINKKFYDAFTEKSDMYKYLAKDISFDLVNQVSKQERISIQKKFNTILLNEMEPNTLTYKLAILATYGKGKVKSDYDIVSGLFPDLEQTNVEELALIYGLYNGYTGLRNKYQSKNGEVNVKFDLSNALQVYIVESLFQYVFNGKVKSESFDFLNLDRFIKININKNKNLKYVDLLGDSYAYEIFSEDNNKSKALSKSLINVVLHWFKQNKLTIDEYEVSKKVEKMLNPVLESQFISDYNGGSIKKEVETPVVNEKPLSLKKQDFSPSKDVDNNVPSKKETKQPIDIGKDVSSKELLLFDEVQKSSEKIYTINQLEKLKGKELKDICKQSGYKGYTKLNVADLRKFILSKQPQ